MYLHVYVGFVFIMGGDVLEILRPNIFIYIYMCMYGYIFCWSLSSGCRVVWGTGYFNNCHESRSATREGLHAECWCLPKTLDPKPQTTCLTREASAVSGS